MAGGQRFDEGQVVVRREVRHGAVHEGMPARVVRDDDDLLVLFVPGGAPMGFGVARYPSVDGRHPWNRGPDTRWQGNGVLMLHRPAEEHAVWVFWHGPEWEFRGWYVNLQDAFRRTEIGIDTFDHELDLVVAPDLTWRFKDAELMPQTVDCGRFTPEEVQTVWDEGRRIGARLDRGQMWWDAGWADWRPPASWQVPPSLPDGWLDVPT